MFGIGKFGDALSLLSDKDKLANAIKKEVPGLLQAVVESVRVATDAPADKPCGVMLFTAETLNGPRLMARVYLIDELQQPVSEVATIDVALALEKVPNSEITKFLPF